MDKQRAERRPSQSSQGPGEFFPWYLPEKADLLNVRMGAAAWVNGAKVYENIRKNVFEKPFDLHDSLKALKIPALVLHGDADPVPSIAAQNTHESIPGSTYNLMENCGHFPYVEDPEIYFKHTSDFYTEMSLKLGSLARGRSEFESG